MWFSWELPTKTFYRCRYNKAIKNPNSEKIYAHWKMPRDVKLNFFKNNFTIFSPLKDWKYLEGETFPTTWRIKCKFYLNFYIHRHNSVAILPRLIYPFNTHSILFSHFSTFFLNESTIRKQWAKVFVLIYAANVNTTKYQIAFDVFFFSRSLTLFFSSCQAIGECRLVLLFRYVKKNSFTWTLTDWDLFRQI